MSDFDPVADFERKFPELAKAFDKVGRDMREALFKSATSAQAEREQIYYGVRGLEAARTAMLKELTNKHVDDVNKERAATLANNG